MNTSSLASNPATRLDADPIVIVGAARTPMGAFQGDFAALSASDLGAVAIRAAIERAGIGADRVQDVWFGNCLMAGQGQAPARQAAIKAGVPVSAGAVTLSKMCGSAMQAVRFACDSLAAGSNDVIVAGGMESMTNAPYLVPKARGGFRIGHGMIFDHMMLDGLEDAYARDDKGGGRAMGTFAEDCAAKYGFTREAQDAFAIASVQRAMAAAASGAFKWEIAPVTVAGRSGDTVVDADEGPKKSPAGKNPHTQTRIQERRHHHRRVLVVDQRRCCGAGLDARIDRARTGLHAAG
jgi:acetyl-CoA C-acetyltransferase